MPERSRQKPRRKLRLQQVPVILCNEWTPAKVKAFWLLVNRSVESAAWDEELLAIKLQEIQKGHLNAREGF